jgi:hypothetical protein
MRFWSERGKGEQATRSRHHGVNGRRSGGSERIRLIAKLDVRRSGPERLVTPTGGRAQGKIRWIIIPRRDMGALVLESRLGFAA